MKNINQVINSNLLLGGNVGVRSESSSAYSHIQTFQKGNDVEFDSRALVDRWGEA